MLTLGELRNQVSVLRQRSAESVTGTYMSAIEDYINLLLESLYNQYDEFDSLKNSYDFTTVDGTAAYYLPQDFEKAFRVYDVTNDKRLRPSDEYDYYDANMANVNDAVESDAETYYMTEVVGVKVQVATTGDTVKYKSSDAADITQTVTVEGYIDSGLTVVGTETKTLTGVPAVSGSMTFYKITHFSKSADTTGYVTLTNSTDTTLGILGATDRVSRHKVINLRLIPDDSTTSIRVKYKKKYRRLVNDNDYPFIDADGYLIYGAGAIIAVQDREEAGFIQWLGAERDKALRALLLNQITKMGTDYQHKMETTFNQAHRS